MPFEITIKDIAAAGGVGRSDGVVYFVPRTVPGDVVLIEQVQDKKSYRIGELVEIVQPSEFRVESKCKYFGKCNGCDWGTFDATEALKYKHKLVSDALRRIANCDVEVGEIVPSVSEYGYRWRLDLNVSQSDTAEVGFIGDDGFFPISDCLLFNRDAAPLIAKAKHYLNYFETPPKRAKIRWDGNRGQIVYIFEQKPSITKIRDDEGDNDIIVDYVAEGRTKRLWGEGNLSFEIGSSELAVYGDAFYQVNWRTYQLLLDTIVQWAGSGKHVWDLYSGVGIASYLLADNFIECTVVEFDSSSIESATTNLSHLSNVNIVKANVNQFIARSHKFNADIIFLNPPRAGVGTKNVSKLAKTKPRKIIYQSCNPATLARDAKTLAKCGYKLTNATPFDFFPQTHHIEVIAQFEG